jgi:hypothetical protein
MKCMNCGLPLSPARTLTNCPRCGVSLNVPQGIPQQQFEQGGWGNRNVGGGIPQENSWVQVGSTIPPRPFAQQGLQNQIGMGPERMTGFNEPTRSGFQEAPLLPRRPYPPQHHKKNSRNLFMVAGLCVIIGALLLVLTMALALGNSSPTTSTGTANNAGSSTPQAASSSTPSNVDASPTESASPSATGTAYPDQQYIDSAQMATGVNSKTMQPTQITNTFTVGSNMYVIFHLHPPGQGGAVCSLWYLNGNQVTSYSYTVSGKSTASYTYATYGSPGPAYVELYWASDKSCSDKVLAQHVDFTVTTP